MCKRVLKSVAGLKNHQRTCLSKTTIINQTNKNKNENNIINLSHSQMVNNINNIAISAENHALTSHVTVISETNVMPKIHYDASPPLDSITAGEVVPESQPVISPIMKTPSLHNTAATTNIRKEAMYEVITQNKILNR